MTGYIYAVIFSQGTVKVGVTSMKADVRMAAHVNMGKRFGIEVHEKFSLAINGDVFDNENKLKAFCRSVSRRVYGDEWFSFDSAKSASENMARYFAETGASS